MTKTLLTAGEAAKLKGVSRSAIYAAIAQGRLPHTRILGRLGLEKADVLSWAPMKYRDRPGVGGGRPSGIPMSTEAKKRISNAQKRRWAQRKSGQEE